MRKLTAVIGLCALLGAGPAFAKSVTYEFATPGVGTIVKVLLPLERKADLTTSLKSQEGESGVGASPAAATG